MLSTSLSKPTDNHFFASVVKSKEFIPMYHDVVLWMLKRDMLVTLHLRIRIVATRGLKLRVNAAQFVDLKIARKQGLRRRRRSSEYDSETPVVGSSRSAGFLISLPKVSTQMRRLSSCESGQSDISELHFGDANDVEDHANVSDNSEADDDEEWDTTEDPLSPSIIYDPGKATPMQRRWLAAMSEGKNPDIAKRFEL